MKKNSDNLRGGGLTHTVDTSMRLHYNNIEEGLVNSTAKQVIH